MCIRDRIATEAFAGGRDTGIAFILALGRPHAIINNPDGSEAHYKGLSLKGRLAIPVVEESVFGLDFYGVARYVDLKNTASDSVRQEVAQHLGAGIGMEVQLTRFVVGVDYSHMMARHYGIGTVSGHLEFEMPLLKSYCGFTIPLDFLPIQLTYSNAKSEIPTSATGFAEASPYNEQAFWIHFKYSTGTSVGKLGKKLIKN